MTGCELYDSFPLSYPRVPWGGASHDVRAIYNAVAAGARDLPLPKPQCALESGEATWTAFTQAAPDGLAAQAWATWPDLTEDVKAMWAAMEARILAIYEDLR